MNGTGVLRSAIVALPPDAGGSIELGRLRSLDRALFTETASVLSDHTHFLPTETSVFDRHAEERVFVLLVVGGKGVLVEQHQFRVIRARFREVWKLLSDGRDQAGLSLHAFVIGHSAMRIADSRICSSSPYSVAHREHGKRRAQCRMSSWITVEKSPITPETASGTSLSVTLR